MGAPRGNTNSADGRRWRAAINRALEKRSKRDKVEALDALAERLLALCDSNDLAALKELGDRIDGKPQQAIVGGDEGDNPIGVALKVQFVDSVSGKAAIPVPPEAL